MAKEVSRIRPITKEIDTHLTSKNHYHPNRLLHIEDVIRIIHNLINANTTNNNRDHITINISSSSNNKHSIINNNNGSMIIVITNLGHLYLIELHLNNFFFEYPSLNFDYYLKKINIIKNN